MGTIAKTDIELVEATRRGELAAFRDLVERYQDMVCAVSYSSTGDRVLSEDVAQETFIAAWRQLDRVRDVMRLGSWLCGIARNLGHKARRRTRREDLVEVDDRVAAEPSPFEVAARGESERVVRDALSRIPEAYREVLVLYYREDQSIRDVAASLAITEAAVMQRLSRGRRYLADSVTAMVERSLTDKRPRRDLVAGVLAAVAALAIPSRVDASPMKGTKGSTMLKLALAATTLAAVGTTAYLVHSGGDDPVAPATPVAATAPLHYGTGPARVPSLGPTAPLHMTAERAVAADDLGLMPADADVVIGVDMARIQRSALWQRFVAPMLVNATGLRTFAEMCGFDPLASLTSVSLGLKGLDQPTSTGTMVIHGFDRTKAMTCFDEHARADAERDGAKVTVDGDVVLFVEPGGGHVGFTFIDQRTTLLVFGPAAATKAGVMKIAAGDGGLRNSPAFSELFGYINSDDALWMVASEGSELVAELNTLIAKHSTYHLNAMYGSIDVTDSLSLQAGLRLGTPELAGKLVADVQSRLDAFAAKTPLAQYFDQLDVNADGGDVIVGIAANANQLVALAAAGAIAAQAGSDSITISSNVGDEP